MIVNMLIALPAVGLALWALSRPRRELPRSVSMSIPSYAREGKWPESTGLDVHLSGHSLETVVRALNTTTKASSLNEASALMARMGYPIAAERLRQKADIITRLVDEDHWMAQGWPQ